jgi:hypothetical protein
VFGILGVSFGHICSFLFLCLCKGFCEKRRRLRPKPEHITDFLRLLIFGFSFPKNLIPKDSSRLHFLKKDPNCYYWSPTFCASRLLFQVKECPDPEDRGPIGLEETRYIRSNCRRELSFRIQNDLWHVGGQQSSRAFALSRI